MNNKSNAIKLVFALVSVVLGILLGWHTLATPPPVSAQSDGMSAYRMADHTRVIAAEERSVFHYERRMYVRDYIIDFMEGLGLVAEVDNFTATTDDIRLSLYEEFGSIITDDFFYPPRLGITMYGSNVLFRQQGRSDTAIMLMAHIDSAGVGMSLYPGTDARSPGASDSGYGVVLMLELARYFEGRELENTIYYFFTDLEELGLLGARHAVRTMDFSNVSMILNLEARGIRGPVYMFETNAGDLETIRFFNEAVRQPLAWSIASAVYRAMPNGTDLTPFLNAGFSGMNFAPLNSLLYYHTEHDSYENISLTTMQHYIDQVGALVELFATDARFSDRYIFNSARTGVYFTLPFGILVLYTDIVAIAISIILFILVGLLIVFYTRSKQIKIGKSAIWSLMLIGALLVSAGIGWLIDAIIFLFVNSRENFLFVISIEMFIMWPVVVVMLALFTFLHKIFRNKFSRNEMAVGVFALLAIINLVISFIMVEATFLITIPLLLALICFLLSKVGTIHQKNVLLYIIMAIPTIVIITLLTPLAFTFTLALTIQGLFVILLLSVLMTMPLPALWRD